MEEVHGALLLIVPIPHVWAPFVRTECTTLTLSMQDSCRSHHIFPDENCVVVTGYVWDNTSISSKDVHHFSSLPDFICNVIGEWGAGVFDPRATEKLVPYQLRGFAPVGVPDHFNLGDQAGPSNITKWNHWHGFSWGCILILMKRLTNTHMQR